MTSTHEPSSPPSLGELQILNHLTVNGPTILPDDPCTERLAAAGVIVRGPAQQLPDCAHDHWYWIRGGRPGVSPDEDVAALLHASTDEDSPGIVEAAAEAIAEVIRQQPSHPADLLTDATCLAAATWGVLNTGPAMVAVHAILAGTGMTPHTIVEVVTDPDGLAAEYEADVSLGGPSDAYQEAARRIRARGLGVFALEGEPQYRDAEAARNAIAAPPLALCPMVGRRFIVVPLEPVSVGYYAPAVPQQRVGGVL